MLCRPLKYFLSSLKQKTTGIRVDIYSLRTGMSHMFGQAPQPHSSPVQQAPGPIVSYVYPVSLQIRLSRILSDLMQCALLYMPCLISSQ